MLPDCTATSPSPRGPLLCLHPHPVGSPPSSPRAGLCSQPQTAAAACGSGQVVKVLIAASRSPGLPAVLGRARCWCQGHCRMHRAVCHRHWSRHAGTVYGRQGEAAPRALLCTPTQNCTPALPCGSESISGVSPRVVQFEKSALTWLLHLCPACWQHSGHSGSRVRVRRDGAFCLGQLSLTYADNSHLGCDYSPTPSQLSGFRHFHAPWPAHLTGSRLQL